jgi:nucleoside-triphosphatase THEP1
VVLDDPHNVIKIDSMGVMEKTIAFFRTSMLNRLNDMARSAIVVVAERDRCVLSARLHRHQKAMQSS